MRARRQLGVEALEDRRLLSIEPVSLAVPALAGDTAGGLNLGNWAWTSDDGRYVAFTSDAPNLVASQVDAQRGVSQWNPDWNPNADVFLFNSETGAKTLISREAGKTTTTANGMSIALGISSDGRFVLFGSVADNLVSSDPSQDSNGGFDIFLYDRLGNGGSGSTQLVSHSTAGLTKAGNGESAAGVLSADGRFVAFTSDATDLAASDTNSASDVFLFEQATGAITLASRSAVTGASGNKGSQLPSIRSDSTGVTVALVSDASNLVAGVTDNNSASDVFLFDYTIATRTGALSLVSHLDSSLTETADGASTDPVINSGDGDYVAYESLATHLVVGQNDTNGVADVFLFSRPGGTSQSRLVSAVGGSGARTGSGESTSPVISADGRYVAFLSSVGNLVVSQTEANAGNDVFLFDRDSGTDSSLALVSHTAGNETTTAGGESSSVSMSDDGRYVAFASQATDLVAPPGDGNNGADVFVYDRTQKASRLVSHDRASSAATGDGESRVPAISGDGLSVVYLSEATNLVAGKGDYNVFPDLVQGRYDAAASTWTNSFVTLRDPGLPPVTGSGQSYVAPLAGQTVSSADGRFVVFTSQASNLVNGSTPPGQTNVFLYDALAGQVRLVSHAVGSTTAAANDSSGAATISADGRYVAFVSKADDLVENLNDRNGMEDVFRFDRLTGEIRLISGVDGAATDTGDRRSVSPAISADGRFIAFASSATDMVSAATDNNQKDDVFLFDATAGSVRLVSVSREGGRTANGQSSDPAISADGTRVAFLSTAPDLVAGQVDGSSTQDAFLFDRTQAPAAQMRMVSRVNGTTATAGNGEVVGAVLSANGQFVAFESLASNLVADPSYDTNGGSDVFLYSVAGSSLELVSRATGSVPTAADRPSATPALSADGRYLAFTSYATNLFGRQDATGGFTNVFLYDRSGNSIQLVSHAAGAPQTPGDSYSMSPVVSADGRFVAYTSMASTLVGSGTDRNESSDVFRFDRLAGANQLVSGAGASPATPGDSASNSPSISGDGRSVVFNSEATNLIGGDYNRTTDAFLFRDGGLVNQAPALNTSVNTALLSIDQDPVTNPGTPVDTLVATTGLYSDPDGLPPAGIAVTAQDTAHGTWWYSTDGGVNWTQFTSLGNTSATLLNADGAGRNRIRFVPAEHYYGTATLSFRAWDGFDGKLSGATGVDTSGGSTAYSSQTETATITVVRSNDTTAPTAALNAPNVNAGSNGTPYVFTVTYADNMAVKVSTLDNADVRVTGPNSFSQLATLDHVDVNSDGTPRTGTYRMTPPGGAWTAAGNGTYTATIVANQVTDTTGNPVSSAPLGTFVVDTVAPTASLNAPGVTVAGGTSYAFTVTFADNLAVKASTLDGADVLVTGPKGFSQSATLVSVDSSTNGTPRTGTYRIVPPGGTWDSTDNGTYTVAVQANQVTDPLGNPVAAGTLGTFAVSAVPDKTAPTATLAAPNVTTNGGATYTFTVTYADNAGIDVATLDNFDVKVTGPNRFSQMAALDHVDAGANGTSQIATYRITPPNGAWGPTGNGFYTVTLQSKQVKDTGGNSVRPGKLGTFTVDAAAPTAALKAANVTKAGGKTYTFTVTYTDNLAVNTSTLGGSDILVTGPNGNVPVTFVKASSRTNGTKRTATYRITPPGGAWGPANNGVYTVTLQSGEVADAAGNPVASGPLGTFTVDTAAPTAALTAPNVTTAGGTTYTFTVAYTDNLAVDVSTLDNLDIRVTGPKGYRQSARLLSVDTSANGSPRTATYQITPSGGQWSAANNGVYTATMLSKQVKDIGGNVVASGKLGTFIVDTVAPTAAVKASNVTKPGGTSYTFTVTYKDNVAVNVATLDSSDIVVTGAGGLGVPATFVKANSRTNGTTRTATYSILPPGGSWDAADNGTYTVTMVSNQVMDTAGNAVATGPLGTFSVSVPGAAVARATATGVASLDASSPVSRATLAAAADAALASVGPQREDAAASAVFGSLGDWVWRASAQG